MFLPPAPYGRHPPVEWLLEVAALRKKPASELLSLFRTGRHHIRVTPAIALRVITAWIKTVLRNYPSMMINRALNPRAKSAIIELPARNNFRDTCFMPVSCRLRGRNAMF